MKTSHILAIDQGTTGSRAIVYDSKGKIAASAYQEFTQFFPQPGWVEHDAEEIWNSVLSVTKKALRAANINTQQIAGIGITNQRETTVLWDKRSGRPVTKAIVWQDRRTSDFCAQLKKKGLEEKIRFKTGLVLDPYFSGTKIKWLLDHVRGLKKRAQKGEILFGTIDTWLLWKMTGGKIHATDFTNASRTLLFNIRSHSWDPQLLKTFGIPSKILPQVKNSAAFYGKTQARFGFPSAISVYALAGDQQAALYGQACYEKGDLKNTYGTGCFAVMNLGKKIPAKPPFGLLATIACDKQGKPAYALEGSVFIGGAVMQWIRDGLKLIKKASDSEKMISKLKDSGGVTIIPAFAGLGSPYWNAEARGMISGITRGTGREHFVRAALESIAHQSADVVEQMSKTGARLHELRVDGGATRNNFLMQFQADLLRIPVWVSEKSEATAWGAAKLAGYACGLWKNVSLLDRKAKYKKYTPKLNPARTKQLREIWKREIRRVTL